MEGMNRLVSGRDEVELAFHNNVRESYSSSATVVSACQMSKISSNRLSTDIPPIYDPLYSRLDFCCFRRSLGFNF